MRWLVAVAALGLPLAAAFGSSCSSTEAKPLGDAGIDREAGLAALESSPPTPIKSQDRRDQSSSPVVFDTLRGGVWTANGDVGTLSYCDIDAQKVIGEVPIGKTITSVALSPDKKWIAAVDRDGASIALVDAETRDVKRVIAVGTHPRAAIWDAWDPRWLYVSLEDDSGIAIIDRTRGVLDHVVAAGRLPAGLAVSRARHELAITHRIDAKLTLLPLEGVFAPADQGEPFVDVGLADQPATVNDATIPNGRPFAFDSFALTPDGDSAWLPHELLSSAHPIQFQRVLFPSVSVVDLKGRAEIPTIAGSGVIAGRKLLFDAINIPDSVGNTSIVSQPCAAAIHPNGNVGYVIACASEDLLTFDVTSGIAIDLLRNLPGDHPTGITLDDTGQRAFIISDQSHTLLTLDLAKGSVLGHARIIAGPLSLAAKDPVLPELREGLKLFYRANSSKGSLSTTGNDWMSCGGCHLDGFVSTNQVFFDALTPADTTKDAQIGHVGLKDLFSTTPNSKTLDPHDVLVALLDQGGLAPDRTGKLRTGAIDPSAPTADASQMAARLSLVIARDLPLDPTWFLAPGTPPNLQYDLEWCGNCHADEYAAWKKSAHAHAAVDPMVKYGMGVEQASRGPQYSRQCAGCHDPVSLRSGDATLGSGRGISCLGCHDVSRLIRAGGNADVEATSHDWTVSHKARASADLVRLRSADFCAGCHQQFVPGTGLVALSTFSEWQSSPYSGHLGSSSDGGADASPPGDAGLATRSCVDCHMPKVAGVADHAAPGGNVYLASTLTDNAFADVVKKKMQSAIALQVVISGPNQVTVSVINNGVGHSFPTGVTDIREPWVEVDAMDAQNKTVQRFGGPDGSGLIPANAARLGIDIASSDGTILLRHELTETTRIPYDQRSFPFGSVSNNGQPSKILALSLPLPAIPQGAKGLDAVLYYRNVRTPYFRAATGNATGSAPEVEVARAHIQ